MHVTPDNHLAFLRNHIITRTDVYARQQKDGRYHKVEKELTDAALRRHLEHKITLGCYNTLDNHVRYALLDVDGHEGKDIIPDEIVRKRVSKLITTLKELGFPFTLAESSPGSYHIAVLFDPITTTEKAYDFIRWVARSAELPNIEVFPKQRGVSEDGYGNLVRLPFGTHRKKQVPYRHINDSFEYVDEFEVKTVDISGLSFPAPAYEKKPDVPYNPETAKPIKDLPIRPCLLRALSEGGQFTGGGGHMFRIFLASAALERGCTRAQVVDLFRGQGDFDLNITGQQVDWLIQKVVGDNDPYHPTCETLRDKCGRFTLKYCDTCRYGRRFKKWP